MSLGPSTTLVVPDARQGPGPMPAAAVAALDPIVARLVARTLPGSRLASGVGLGTELAQLSPYEPGDDVRHLDPAASARTGTLHVRRHVPERALTTWIVLDRSPSMAFGTRQRLKADVAEGVAIAFGRIGVRRAGSVGAVAFGTAEPHAIAPRGAKPGLVALRRLLAGGVAPDGTAAPEALADAIRRTDRLARQPGLVVIISDFRDQDGWERPLGALRLRHAVIAVEVGDPAERELPAAGTLAVVDPETGRLTTVAAGPRLRARFAAIESARRARIADELRRLRVTHARLDTGEDWLRALGRSLR